MGRGWAGVGTRNALGSRRGVGFGADVVRGIVLGLGVGWRFGIWLACLSQRPECHGCGGRRGAGFVVRRHRADISFSYKANTHTVGPFGSHSRILIFIGANTDTVGPFGSHGRALITTLVLWVLLGPTAVLLFY